MVDRCGNKYNKKSLIKVLTVIFCGLTASFSIGYYLLLNHYGY